MIERKTRFSFFSTLGRGSIALDVFRSRRRSHRDLKYMSKLLGEEH
jgi:hypothetical protein